MKEIFYLPAHPSYFDSVYTQDEIDRAIASLDRMYEGRISNGDQRSKHKVEFVLMRKPGEKPNVRFDSVAGVEDRDIERFRRLSAEELETHIKNLKFQLEATRKFT